MSLVSQHLSDNNTNSLLSSTEFDDTRDESTNSFTEAALSKLLGVSTNSSRRSMDRGATQYSQSGLHSPFQHAFNDAQSEEESAEGPQEVANLLGLDLEYKPRFNDWPNVIDPSLQYWPRKQTFH